MTGIPLLSLHGDVSGMWADIISLKNGLWKPVYTEQCNSQQHLNDITLCDESVTNAHQATSRVLADLIWPKQ